MLMPTAGGRQGFYSLFLVFSPPQSLHSIFCSFKCPSQTNQVVYQGALPFHCMPWCEVKPCTLLILSILYSLLFLQVGGPKCLCVPVCMWYVQVPGSTAVTPEWSGLWHMRSIFFPIHLFVLGFFLA